ncbi:SDR family oxidoreductase [Cryobacterium sp. Sr8]|uniref:SDR family NAD(P)-dependent oxidoreductase n=1 Tax=Cryobacterium sp. Sr8 TaxID=1259203 RepID=UPI0018E07929|nr:SDR family oxidoreductase [Cryobacterium sp. Sr8]
MARSYFTPMGTTALITGASSGLGIGFAHRLAERGADLVLVARRQDRLEALAVELAEKYGTASTVIPLDLTGPDAVAELVTDLRTRSVTVGTLVNNAGFATFGPFAVSDAGLQREQVALNVQVLTELTRAFLPDLLQTAGEHPHGAALVNLASTAAFQPVPRMAVYGATKAYVLSFTEALWYETHASGLKVTALCPGPVATEFSRVAGVAARRRPQSVDQVMRTVFADLDRGTPPPHRVSGARNAALAWLSRALPRGAVVKATGRLTARRRTA